jgi:hypothetical protein
LAIKDLFFIFAALTLFSLEPVLLTRGGKLSVASADGAEAMMGKQRRAKKSLHECDDLSTTFSSQQAGPRSGF